MIAADIRYQNLVNQAHLKHLPYAELLVTAERMTTTIDELCEEVERLRASAKAE